MRRRSRLLAVTVGALASAMAACSVITGLNADYTREDNDNGGDADATVGDESAPPGPDSTPPPDANVDAGTFCDQHGGGANVAFCWDFERSGTDPSGGFDLNEVTPGIGSIALSHDGGTNGSTCLVASLFRPKLLSNQAYVRKIIRDGGADDEFQVWNEHDLQFAFTIYHNELDTAAMGSLGFGDALTVTGISSWIQNSQNKIDISSPPGNVGGSAPPTVFGAWYRGQIHLERSASGTPYAMTISVFDANDAGGPVDEGNTFDGGVGPAELLFGAYFSSQTTADAGITVGIDDILYTRSK